MGTQKNKETEMKRRTLLPIGLAPFLLALQPASAGPLMDWLRERRAERNDDAAEEDGTAQDATGHRAYKPPASIRMERDLAYGSDPAQRLDVYFPSKPEKSPIVVMVHGGGWRRGDKGGTGMVGNKVQHWVSKGWTFVSVNYRLVPAVTPVVQAEDIARALAFVQSKAPNWGADPGRCVLMGHSAGAHLVSLVSSDPGIAARAGAKPWSATVAIDSAAFDVVAIMNRKHYGLYDIAFGKDTALWREASPLHRLQGKPAAPMLLVCSSKRDDSCGPAEEFARKATAFGGRVTVLPIALNHAKINSELGADRNYTASVDAFLNASGLN